MPKFYGLPAFPINRSLSVREKAQAKHFITPTEHHKVNYNLRAVSYDSFKVARAAEANPTPTLGYQQTNYYGKVSPRRA